jgi:glutamate synthase (NADPH/NADH) small chain
VEVLCEGACVFLHDGQPAIDIGRLQRHALDHGGGPELLPRAAQSTGKSVGLVGAGPASLACAGYLALAGHAAVLYEKRSLPGGLNTTGVAPYKFRTEAALAEVEAILKLGVDVRPGVEIGRDLPGREMLTRHDAVFLGPGLGPDSRLGVVGEDGPWVEGATSWIERMKNDADTSLEEVSRAVVVGAGNTAIDAARELRGLGMPFVTLLVRRAETSMRAYAHESGAARAEGVLVRENVAVAEVLRSGDRVTGVRLVETEDGRPTDRERGILPANLVLVAIGQARITSLAAEFPGVDVDDRGRLVVDAATGRTGNDRVFAGGDAVNGGREVVNAAAEGRIAALAIDAMLREGNGG